MHPACPNKKQNHLQNSLLRRTQFWVRKTFSKPASLKRASLVHLHTLTSAHLHLHTLTPADLHLHICRSTSSHPLICRSTFSQLQNCRSASSHPLICRSMSSHLHICKSLALLSLSLKAGAVPPERQETQFLHEMDVDRHKTDVKLRF